MLNSSRGPYLAPCVYALKLTEELAKKDAEAAKAAELAAEKTMADELDNDLFGDDEEMADVDTQDQDTTQ